jgi:hypothetical protein
MIYFKKPSVLGAVQGMITGLVAITPAAGVVAGWGAICIGFASGTIPVRTPFFSRRVSIFPKLTNLNLTVAKHEHHGQESRLLPQDRRHPRHLPHPLRGRFRRWNVRRSLRNRRRLRLLRHLATPAERSRATASKSTFNSTAPSSSSPGTSYGPPSS